MFRIEIFVDDRKLPYVLWALSGHCIEVKAPQPVQNAQVKDGKIRAKTPTGELVTMFIQHLKDQKITDMFGPDIPRDFMVAHGYSSKSYSNLLYSAVEAKVLKRIRVKGGKGYRYALVK